MKIVPKIAKYIQLFLLCLSVVFVITIWLELNRGYSLHDTSATTSNSNADLDTIQDSQLPTLAPITEFASIIERPLFMSDRRPYVPGDEEIEAPQPRQAARGPQIKPKELLLSAVIITGDKRIALVQTGNDKKLHRLGPGENIDGWTITEIRNKEISLTKDSETKSLELLVKSSPAKRSTQARRQRRASTQNRRTTQSRRQQLDQVDRVDQINEAEAPTHTSMRTPVTGEENIRQPTPEQLK